MITDPKRNWYKPLDEGALEAQLQAKDVDLARLRAQVVELQAELAEWKGSHALMAAQFRVMQREKEHGWQESYKREAEVEELTAQRQAVLDICARLRRLGWRTVDLIDVQSALLSPKT